MKKKKLALLVATGLLTATMITACGGNSNSSETTVEETTVAETETSTEIAETTATSENSSEESSATDTDVNAEENGEDDLVSAVTEIIDGSVGEDEQITSVVLDGKNLIVTVDLSGSTIPDPLSARDVALMRISSITDNILELDDTYYNAWDTITLDFGAEGTAVLDKSMIKNEGYGSFFSFDDSILQ